MNSRTVPHESRPQRLPVGRAAGWSCALLLTLLWGVPVCGQSWFPQGGIIPSREPAGYVISRTPHPAVVRIIAQEKNGASFGTGSLVDVRGEQGLIVTNWHVIRDANPSSIYVFFPDGFQSAATVVKADSDWDLAALSVRKPPTATPIAIARTAPRAGDWLCIAGYGSGDYRAAAGRCTQYVSPGVNMPYEMVEVAAEARQGDSGGPIFNEQGELAGVLFGSAKGTTSGSYAGRVLNFLQGVAPVETPLATTMPPATNWLAGAAQAPAPSTNLPPSDSLLPSSPVPNEPASDAHLFAPAPPPSSNPPAAEMATASTSTDRGELAPVERDSRPPLPLVPLPQKSAAPLTLVTSEEPIDDDRTALRPTSGSRAGGLEGQELALQPREGPIAAEALNIMHTPLPARLPPSAALENMPADQLIAAAWKQIGGDTLFDQGKTLLAILGMLGLLIQFWRMNSRSDMLDDE
jgi:S1-C subfamily serine protease